MERVAAVIVAAGYGQIVPGRSKLLELLEGKSLLQHVVENAKAAGLAPVFVVINHTFGPQIQQAMDACGHADLVWVYQKKRKGAANAVFRALPYLRGFDVNDFVVLFGDMPNISPKHIKLLADLHASSRYIFSYTAWKCEENHALLPYMRNYVFTHQSESCEHVGHKFLFLYSGRLPIAGSMIFSSLFALRTEHYCWMYRKIRSHSKGDGYLNEYHLPCIVDVMSMVGVGYQQIEIDAPHEIIGANTAADLELVGRLMRQTHNGHGR